MLLYITFGAVMYLLSIMSHKLFEIINSHHSHHDHGTGQVGSELTSFKAALEYQQTVIAKWPEHTLANRKSGFKSHQELK